MRDVIVTRESVVTSLSFCADFFLIPFLIAFYSHPLHASHSSRPCFSMRPYKCVLTLPSRCETNIMLTLTRINKFYL